MDPFYELYRNAGLVPIEIVESGIIALICLIGICLNSSLIYVSVKTKSLHSPCNILIALYAFSASFLLFGNTIKFFVFLFGINFIPLWSCYIIMFVPLIGASFATKLQFCIGLERLAGVAWPFWYKLHGKHYIYKILLFFICIHALFGVYIFYNGASQHWNKPMMCTFSDITYLPESASITNISTLIIYIGEFVSYALIWLIIWFRKTAVSNKNRKLALSLTIIMSMSLFLYIGGLVFTRIILPFFPVDMLTMEYTIMPIMSALSVIGHSSVMPILLLCSEEYLRAFRHCFGFGQQQQQVHVVKMANLVNSVNVSSANVNNQKY